MSILDTELGGAGDRTSDLPVTSQPALPPEPHASALMGSEVNLRFPRRRPSPGLEPSAIFCSEEDRSLAHYRANPLKRSEVKCLNNCGGKKECLNFVSPFYIFIYIRHEYSDNNVSMCILFAGV
ncbi:unnamed protein product [Arctogadus glacialis]